MSLLKAIKKAAGSSTAIEPMTAAMTVSTAVQQIVGAAAMAPASAPERAMVRQEISGAIAVSAERRKKALERELFLRAVWYRWHERGLSFAAAAIAAEADVWERCPILQQAGNLGVSALTETNARNWFKKLGKARDGSPRFDLAAERLADGYDGCGRSAVLDAEFMQDFSRLLLSPGQRTLVACYKAVVDQFRADGIGERCPSLAQVKYFVKTKVSEYALTKARCGRDYKNLLKGFIRRYKNFGPGDVWFADHRTVDFWIKWPHPVTGEFIPVRPYVTAVMDSFTGRILAYVIYADVYPNSGKIMEAFELAVRQAGGRPPKYWYTDNGKDFLKFGFATMVQLRTKKGELVHKDGKVFTHSCLAEMGSEHMRSRGFNGREKPIERLFRDQAVDFDPMQPGYCGNSPATRPDYGETFQGDMDKLPTEYQAAKQLSAWVEKHNATPAKENDPSPNEIWAAADWTPFRKLSDAELFLAMLLPQPLAPEVGRSSYGLGAVMFDGVAYTHRALREFADGCMYGQPVMVKTYWGMPAFRDDKGKVHPKAIFVFHPDGRMICMAEPEESAAMIATTPEEKEQLARLCHVVAWAAAEFDKPELERLTGSERVRMTLPALPHGEVAHSAPVMNIGAPGMGSRRVKGGETEETEKPAPTPKLSAEEAAAMQRAVFGGEQPSPASSVSPASSASSPAMAAPVAPAANDDEVTRALRDLGM